MTKLVKTDLFEEFWHNYPRREVKRRAKKCWDTRVKEGVAPKDMILAAKHYFEARQGEPRQFTKLPSTFLGPDMDFEDWIKPPKPEPKTKVDKMLGSLKKMYDKEK